MQNKLKPGPLLEDSGNLAEAGYATSLVKEYDRSRIKAGKTRIKEWDYYLIHNDRFGVALTVADNSYMGLVSISFLDFKERREVTKSPMLFLPMGKTSYALVFRDRGCEGRRGRDGISVLKSRKTDGSCGPAWMIFPVGSP